MSFILGSTNTFSQNGKAFNGFYGNFFILDTINSGGASYGNYTLGQIQGCTSAEDLWTLSYDSEQTLTTSFFGYNSTTVLMQSVVYELQMNYSPSGVADNIQYKLYLSYETIPNSPNNYSNGPIARIYLTQWNFAKQHRTIQYYRNPFDPRQWRLCLQFDVICFLSA